MMCHYCGRHFPEEEMVRVHWVGDRQENVYCEKHFPEVVSNMKSVP